ncbi:serine/threonine protein kinase [Candidatus Woesearchaeota archaeon]|nr:serine/threonine protein kinase [Candidatus Woesearchaeota archaeon]
MKGSLDFLADDVTLEGMPEPESVPQLGEYHIFQALDGSSSSLNTCWIARDGSNNFYHVKRFSGHPEAYCSASKALKVLRGENYPKTLLLPTQLAERENFFITPYLRGKNLDERMKIGPFSFQETLSFLSPIALGLDFIHGLGMLHRDTTPKNIFLEEDGNRIIPRLTDFDLLIPIQEYCHLIQETEWGRRSMASSGTPLYMAPEVIKCLPADGKADLYALALIAFQCITGRHPFFDKNPYRAQLLHCDAPVPAASLYNTKIPSEMDDVFFTALAKSPEERYQTCRQFIGELFRAGGNFPISANAKQRARMSSSLWGAIFNLHRKFVRNKLAEGILPGYPADS